MHRLFPISLLFAALATIVNGCGQAGPVRAPVQGKITVGGQPLTGGRILFTPMAPNSGPTVSARIASGEYQLSKAAGPVVGQNRVEVEADLDLGFALDDEAAYAKRGKPLPPNPVPPEFNVKSTLLTEVRAGATNTFDVTIPGPRQTVARPTY